MSSGFDEIKIGLIPPTKDCIVIGDIERTRLDNIRAMFFVGVNDGYVPKKRLQSVLSETDREKLKTMDVSLSMSVREKAFVQRFYLYLIMTKTSQKLYITYAHNSMDMKAILPSYIIRMIKKMFPGMDVLSYDDAAKSAHIYEFQRLSLSGVTRTLQRYLQTVLRLTCMEKSLQEVSHHLSSMQHASMRTSAAMD